MFHGAIKKINNSLLSWYEESGRQFPWRKKSVTKYQLIVTEILLQRTRSETVANFFKIFFKQYPSWKKLAEAEEYQIGRIIKPIGLWRRRATIIKQLAMKMAMRNGRYPKTRSEIEQLPV